MSDNQLIPLPIWQGQEGDGRCKISLILIDTGNGVNGLLTGGEKPHVGGVVLALPRPSLSGKGWSTDVYITPVPGHKDVDVAQTVAKQLARELRCPVVVTSGIHSDQLCPEELNEIIGHCDTLTQTALAHLLR
ncbi:MAG: proteasome assembly chaperone 4 family protein [Desulfosporosinus sp.]|nr:proteasome assembly chaperone 4 family protein [Desulfosporosinus sp.]